MGTETHGNKGIDGGMDQVNQGRIEYSSSSSRNSSNSNNGDGGETGVLNDNSSSLQSSKGVVSQEMNFDQSRHEVSSGNSTNLVNEVVIVINSGEIVGINGETKDLGANIDELSSRVNIVATQDVHGGQGNVDQVSQGINGDSSNSVTGVVVETVIVMNLQQDMDNNTRGNGGSEAKRNDLGSSTAAVDKSNTEVLKGLNPSCVVDVKGVGIDSAGGGGGCLKDNWDGERVCRICHLNSEGSFETAATTTIPTAYPMDLIQLGCGCKDELGIAHVPCAEAWFKLKGNRICEICGQTAKNVTVVGDYRFLERRFITTSIPPDSSSGCWRGQPFCNFLMACLVVAFVLPWFFRVNMF